MNHPGSGVTEDSSVKSSSASQSVAYHPAAGRVRVPLLPTLQELISVPIAGIGGLEKIFTLFENFTPPFPEKEVKRDKWVQPKRISPVWPHEFLQQSKLKQTRKINEHENHKICNRSRLTVGRQLTRNSVLQPGHRHRIYYGSGHPGCLQLANN
jgi:hypothetical protein